ncbi:diguanylate cyclase (GGDEF) domain-containing protein [Aeromonas sp. RU39B]|uniref:GGDEF domain-containing protein n=1 Tax=Aeromonas sp. RU39B TaxID=1907416 RepID=UPI0009545145|nr:GGDEF domain-containing protein [Aeromonas sp. RU39B]SIP89722.1 diguanylate cyclase (GGDEF) domain-containing protein [Aeromonas sp. RU39B]
MMDKPTAVDNDEMLRLKQRELEELKQQTVAERNRVTQFISKLMLACRGHDRELDTKLAKLRHRLDVNQPYTVLDAELALVERLLQHHAEAVKGSIKSARNALQYGAKHIKPVKDFSEKACQALREHLLADDGYSFGDYHLKVLKLLEYYQQALKYQQAGDPLLRSHLDDGELEPAYSKLADELQRLITELDFAGDVGERLDNIRRELLGGVPLPKLAELSLQVIELIIQGTREERKASQTFLIGLNESLSAVHFSFTESLDEGRALQDETSQSRQALNRELQSIGVTLDNHHKVDDLRLAVHRHLDSLSRLLGERDALYQRERHLLTRLSSMEAKLRLMKDETAEYKKRLAIQKHKLFLDSLTQVHNRAALDERLELEYKRWLRYQTPLCLAVIDIDHFKSINDNYGHMAGDKALKVVAKALQRALRDTDFIARFGGEEFVVLLPNINPDKFLKPLDKLRQTIKNIPFRFKDAKVEITISVGATLFRDGDETTDAFERADQALYSAKHSGRDQVNIVI